MTWRDRILKRLNLRRATRKEKDVEKYVDQPRQQTSVIIETKTSDTYRGAEGATYKDPPPINLTIFTMRKMICDAVVQFGFNMLTMPLRQAKVQTVGDSDVAEVQTQIDLVQRLVVESGVLKSAIESLRWGVAFGFAGLELRWDVVDNIVVPCNPKLLRWEDVTILEEDQEGKNLGAFKGFEYQNTGASNDKPTLLASENKAALFTWLEHLTRGRYGWSQLTPAYEPWRKRRYAILQDFAYYLEKYANPALIGKYPPGKLSGVDNGERIMTAMEHLRQGGNAAMPSVFDDNNNPVWSIEPMQVPARSSEYEAADRIYKTEILQALIVPPRAVTEGLHGTKAEAETHGQVLEMMRNAIFEDMINVIDNSIIQPLLAFNFPNPNSSVHLAFNVMSEQREAAILLLMTKIMEAWFNGNPVDEETQAAFYRWTGIRVPEPPQIKGVSIAVPKPPEADIPITQPEDDTTSVETQSVCQHEFMDSRVLLSKIKSGEYKLSREPSEVEKTFYSKDQFIQMLTVQVASEAEIITELENLVDDQRAGAEAFVRNVWANNKTAGRMSKALDFMLRKRTTTRSLVRNWIEDQTLVGAEQAFKESEVEFPGKLDGDRQAWVRARGSQITTELVQRVEDKVRKTLIDSARLEEDVQTAVRKIHDIFNDLKSSGKLLSISYLLGGMASEARSIGRQMILATTATGAWKYNGKDDVGLGGEEEIVAVYRSEILDSKTCRNCERLDKLVIRADDERLSQWIAPQKCLGNLSGEYRCRGLNFYLKKKMREALRDITMPDPPGTPLPASWVQGLA
ncbi:hypothetical protein ES703_07986 [subsurface metagenome]